MKHSLLSLALLVGLFSTPNFAQNVLPRGVSPNGAIFSMDQKGDVMYFGGRFDKVGHYTGASALYSDNPDIPDLNFPFIEGEVFAVISDGDGGWYIGGEFEKVGFEERTHLAHIFSNFEIDPDFRPELNGAVFALHARNDTLFIGGTFTQAGNTSNKFLTAYDLESNEILDFLPSPNSRVLALETYRSSLAVGGWFSQIGAGGVKYLSRINLKSGDLEPMPPVLSFINTFLRFNDSLFIGGHAPNALLAVDLDDGSPLDWAPKVSGFGFGQRVNSLLEHEGIFYFGGSFGTINGAARGSFGAVDLDGNLLPLTANVDKEIFALHARGDSLYLAGTFETVAGDSIAYSAKIHLETGARSPWTMGSDWAPKVFFENENGLLAAGEFDIVKYVERENAFAMNMSTMEVLPWNPSVDLLTVSSLVADPTQDAVYLAGYNLPYFQAVDGTLGAPLTGWNVSTNRTVHSIDIDPGSGTVYLGGEFTQVNGSDRSYVAAFSSDGDLLPFQAQPDDQVNKLAFSTLSNYLYIAGNFREVNGEDKYGLAALDEGGNNMVWDVDMASDQYDLFRHTYDILPLGDQVFLSGNFISINGEERRGVASVDPVTGELLDWDAEATTDGITRMGAFGEGLIIHGLSLEAVGNTRVHQLAYVGASSAEVLGATPEMDMNINWQAYGFGAIENQLVLGGSFQFVEQKKHPFLAQFEFSVEPSVYPEKGGNNGDVTLQIQGQGLDHGTTFFLRRGNEEIRASIDPDSLLHELAVGASYDLRGQSPGFWDVVIEVPGKEELVLEEAFEITDSGSAQVWVEVIAPPNARAGTSLDLFLSYGNSGDIDAHGVPIWLAISPNIEVEDFGFTLIELESIDQSVRDSIPEFIRIDSLNGEAFPANVYAWIVPRIAAGSSKVVRFTVKTEDAGNAYIRAWANEPLYGSPLKYVFGECADKVISAVLGYVPVAGCLFGVFDAVVSPIVDSYLDPNFLSNEYMISYYTALGSTMFSCAGDLVTGGVGKIVLDVINYMLNAKSVTDIGPACWPPDEKDDVQVEFLISHDPNDKSGLSGQGEEQWINTRQTFPYLIRFENMAEATAPALEVVIRDTLDTQVFDLSTLTLKGFSIADSFYVIPPRFMEYETTVDLRPRLPYKVSVEISLKKQTGALAWSFVTLDPVTGDPVTGAQDGFLPPNVDSISGTGSILFDLQVHDTISTGTDIDNKASIYFDFNEPIVTNTWHLKADNSPPVSSANTLPDTLQSSFIELEWEGEDSGSGIRFYDVMYRQHPDSSWRMLTRTSATLLNFGALEGTYYEFATIAVDTAQNKEESPLLADAVTFFAGQITSSEEVHDAPEWSVYPNPARERVMVELPEFGGPSRLVLSDLNGKELRRWEFDGGFGIRQEIDVSGYSSGVYILRWESKGFVGVVKVLKL